MAAALCLTACAELQQGADATARSAARAAVDEVLVTRFPGIDGRSVTPFTDCVIDNASAAEIAEFAEAAVVGVSEVTVAVIRQVLARPDTQTCITRAGAGALAA